MRVSIIFVYIIVQLVSISGKAQDWKSNYDKSVQLYQEESYQASLEAAKQAYVFAKKNDQKSLAYTLQLLTANYLQLAYNDEALLYAEEEVNVFVQLESEQSKNYAEALKKQLSLLYSGNKVKDAYEKSAKTLQVSKSVFGESSYEYAALLSLAGQISIGANQFETAKGQLDAALLLLEKIPDAGEDYLNTLSVAADLDRRNKADAEAEKKYRKLASILEQNGLQQDPLYVETKRNLDQLIISRGSVADVSSVVAGGTQDVALRAQGYLKLAIDFQQKKNPDKAFENYELAKKAVVEGGLQDKTTFSIYLNSARYALEQQNLDQAKEDVVQLNLVSSKLFKADQVEYRMAELTHADYLLEISDVEKASLVYSAVAAHAQQNPSAIPGTFIITSTTRLLNKHQTIIALELIKPVAINKGLPSNDQLAVDILFSDALQRSGQGDEAISYLKNAVERIQESNMRAAYQVQLAEVQKNKGAWNDALATLMSIQTLSISPLLVVEIDYQKARLHQVLGQYREAEQFYRTAIANGQSNGAKEVLQQVKNSLATFYTTIGNYEAAEDVYEQLLADKTLDDNFRITVFQNLATVYQQTLRYKEAQGLLEQVVKEDAMRLGERDPDYALSLQNLASVYQRTGDYQKALQLYSKALEIDASTQGDASLPYATKAANLGVAQMELGELEKAQSNLQKALRIREQLLGKEHPDYVFNEYNLAVLYQRQQRSDLALPLYKHISDFYIRQIAELFPALSEKEKTAYFNKINEVILAYMDFAVDQNNVNPFLVGDLFDFRLMTKALLLNASTKIRNRILTGNDPVLKQQFTEWLQVKEELGKLYTQNLDSRNQAKLRIEKLQQRVNEIEKQLASKSELFAKSTDREVTTWQQLQAKLKPEEVAVEMIRLRLNYKNDSVIYAALVIRPTWKQPQMVIFSNGRSMEQREFRYYRNATRFSVENERSYNVYWKPLESLMKGATTVYFSSDGVYNKINLSSLYNTEKNHYLIDQYSFALLSNLKELNRRDEPLVATKTATLFGSPDFGFNNAVKAPSSSTLRSIVGTDFQDLPGTKTEIERINTLLQGQQWKVNQFLSQDASEEKMKSLDHVGILHIATHGFFIADGEDDAHVIFTDDLEQIANNPLLRSGLILSGVGKDVKNRKENEEDGILTAYEAIGLPLENTNIVILSACETGQGEVRNGEGVYGLQRAILLAGARHLLMSLWKVDDEATQELMTEFYKQWLATNDLRKAYRNAQLTMKTKYGMPHYWAGFVLVGI